MLTSEGRKEERKGGLNEWINEVVGRADTGNSLPGRNIFREVEWCRLYHGTSLAVNYLSWKQVFIEPQLCQALC